MRPATVVGVLLLDEQGDDAAHDLETADGQGPYGPVAQPRSISASPGGTFPAPVPLGGRVVGWIEAEVHAWLTARIAQRRLIAPGERGSSHDPSQEGIVKLTKSSSIDPQDIGLQPVSNPPC